MLYVSGQPIYVFYSGDRSYSTYAQPRQHRHGQRRRPRTVGGLFKPARAFGVVWTAQKLQGRLGYATAASESGGAGTIQTFENGTILSVGSDVYVLTKTAPGNPSAANRCTLKRTKAGVVPALFLSTTVDNANVTQKKLLK